MPLQTLEPPQRLYRQIADQVRSLIAAGEFQPGSRLPAERELATQLGVSRPSVREALIALEVEGRVEVRVGSGVYVRPPAAPGASATPVPAAEWGPFELLHARRVIEGEIAALAATRAKRRDREQIRAAIDAMRSRLDDGATPLEADGTFHEAVAQASGNAVLLETVQAYWHSRHGRLFEQLGGHFESRSVWRLAVAEHEAVLAAIEARDPDAARAAMHRHMDRTHARFSASWRRAGPA